jgi:hypothetical protein
MTISGASPPPSAAFDGETPCMSWHWSGLT